MTKFIWLMGCVSTLAISLAIIIWLLFRHYHGWNYYGSNTRQCRNCSLIETFASHEGTGGFWKEPELHKIQQLRGASMTIDVQSAMLRNKEFVKSLIEKELRNPAQLEGWKD